MFIDYFNPNTREIYRTLLLKQDYNSGEFFVFNQGVAISAEFHYGLDGVTDSLLYSSCNGIGRGFFVCDNKGTNPNKVILLKSGSTPSFQTISVTPQSFFISKTNSTQNSAIIRTYDYDTGHLL